MLKNNEFDMESFRKEAIAKLQAGEGLLEEGGAFMPLIKAFLEQAMEGEVEEHIAQSEYPNQKNGKNKWRCIKCKDGYRSSRLRSKTGAQ